MKSHAEQQRTNGRRNEKDLERKRNKIKRRTKDKKKS